MYRVALLTILSATLATAASPDEEAVRSVIADYMGARNSKSPEALRHLFTPDADQLVSNGQWRHGIDELVRGMMASSGNEQSKSRIEITDIRMLDKDIALVDGRYQTTAADGTVRNMWTTFVLRRTVSGYRISAIRNMKPAP